MTESAAELLEGRLLTGLSGTPERVVVYRDRLVVPCGCQERLVENPLRLQD
jgi:hypothetical protein